LLNNITKQEYRISFKAYVALGGKKPQVGFFIIKKSVRSWVNLFYDSLNMEWAQNATITAPALDIVRHDLKLARTTNYFETGEILCTY